MASDVQDLCSFDDGAAPAARDRDDVQVQSSADADKPLAIWTNLGPSPAITRAELEVIETYFADLLDEVLAAEP